MSIRSLDAQAPLVWRVDAVVQALKPSAKAPLVLRLEAIVLATSEETVAIVIEMVRGDTRPTLEFAVKDQNGVAINITGSTPRFRIRRRGQTAVLVTRVCTITDGPNGKCQFAWAAADWIAGALDAKGHYDGELEVTFSDLTIGSAYALYNIVARDQVG